jgi:hypothetical protein
LLKRETDGKGGAGEKHAQDEEDGKEDGKEDDDEGELTTDDIGGMKVRAG